MTIKEKMAWRTLDDRQMGEALAHAYRTTVGFCRSQVNDKNKKEWQDSCHEFLEHAESLCDVADERSVAGGGDRMAKRKEFEMAKGLDFHGSKDLMYLEQRIMEISSSWPHHSLQEEIKKCTQWRDGKSAQIMENVFETPFENVSVYPTDIYGKGGADAFLPYPNEANTVLNYGRTQKEEDADFKAAQARMAKLKVR